MTTNQVALTTEDYTQIGAAFVAAVLTSNALGHVSCAGLADYISRDDLETAEQALVLDAFTATRLDGHAKPAQVLMAEWVERRRFEREALADAVARSTR